MKTFPTLKKFKFTRKDFDKAIEVTFKKAPATLNEKLIAVTLYEYFTLEVMPKLTNSENKNKAMLFHEFLLHSKELLAN